MCLRCCCLILLIMSMFAESGGSHGVGFLQNRGVVRNDHAGVLSTCTEMDSRDWKVSDTAARPQLIRTVTWSVGDGTSAELASFTLPHDLVASRIIEASFTRFRYYRGNIVLRFFVNASPMHAGRLAAFYIPGINATAYGDMFQGRRAYIPTLDHVFLDPAKSTVAELRIPYRHVMDYLFTSGYQPEDFRSFLGFVKLVVFNPLATGVGSVTSVNVSVTAYVEDGDFRVPIQGAPVVLYEDEEPAGNSLTRVINVTGENNHISTKDAYHQSATTDAKADVDVTPPGMHAPNLTYVPIQVQPRVSNCLSNSRNAYAMERLTLNPNSINNASKDMLGSTVDESDLQWLLGKFNFVKTLSWSSANPPGYLLHRDLITPVTRPSVAGDHTILTYFNNITSFWKGTLVYRVQVVASMFHRGQLFFSINYGSTQADGSTTSYGNYLSIENGANEFFIEVPFVSPTPAKRCGREGYSPVDYSTGSYSISVVNALAHPETVSGVVEVNVFIAGKDLQFHYMGEATSVFYRMGPHAVARAEGDDEEPASGTEEINSEDQEETSALPPTDTLGVVPWNHFGETIASITDILRRGYYVSTKTLDSTLLVVDLYDLLGRNNLSLPGDTSVFNYLMAFYRCYRGSLRLHLGIEYAPGSLEGGVSVSCCAFSKHELSAAQVFASNVRPMAVLSRNTPFIELEIPYLSIYSQSYYPHFRPYPGPAVADDLPPGFLDTDEFKIIMRPLDASIGSTQINAKISFHLSCSNDFRPSLFMGLPLLMYDNRGDANFLYPDLTV